MFANAINRSDAWYKLGDSIYNLRNQIFLNWVLLP
jgi:hypothetical protein